MKWNLCRYAFENGRPVPEYLCRHDGERWFWSRERKAAFTYDKWLDADAAKTAHACKDEKGDAHNLFAMPVSKSMEEPT